MKKILAFFLPVLFAISMCACNDSKSSASNDESSYKSSYESSYVESDVPGYVGTWKMDTYNNETVDNDMTEKVRLDYTLELNADNTFCAKRDYMDSATGQEITGSITITAQTEHTGTYEVNGNIITITVTGGYIKTSINGETSESEPDLSDNKVRHNTLIWNGDTISFQSLSEDDPNKDVILKKQ